MGIFDGLRSETDTAEIDAALQGERDAEKQKGDLYQKGEALHRSLAARCRELAAAAFEAETSGDAAQYERLKAGIAQLEDDVSRIEAAMVMADQKLLEAQQ